MGRLRVQHCIVNAVTRQYGPHPTSDLLGVDFYRTIPSDVEFPWVLRKLELFVRFYGIDVTARAVWLTMTWLRADGTDRQEVFRKRVALPVPLPSGAVLFDRGLKLVNVTVPGEGRYAIRVLRPVRRRWESRRGWRVLAADTIAITRAI